MLWNALFLIALAFVLMRGITSLFTRLARDDQREMTHYEKLRSVEPGPFASVRKSD